MEWTDGKLEERLDRIDERFSGVDQRFDDVNRRITETRGEMKERFERVENTMVELKQQMAGLNTTFQRGNFALITAVCGVIAAVLARGG
jgi:flagellar capping protein FliD